MRTITLALLAVLLAITFVMAANAAIEHIAWALGGGL